jgi:hypothetical protein
VDIQALRKQGFYIVIKTWNHGPDIYVAHFPTQDEAEEFGRAEGAKLPNRLLDKSVERQEWIEVIHPDTNRRSLCGPAMEF